MRFSQRFLVVFSLVLLVGVSAFAQGTGTRSSLSGIVTTGGKPLPGVSVTVSSPALQGTRTTVTGEGGGYNFSSLPPGMYIVTMELEGMQKDGDLSTDELDRVEKDLEKITQDQVAAIDQLLAHKEQELLQV